MIPKPTTTALVMQNIAVAAKIIPKVFILILFLIFIQILLAVLI